MATGKRLGKGLGALFSNYDEDIESSLDKIRTDEFASPPSKVAEPLTKPAPIEAREADTANAEPAILPSQAPATKDEAAPTAAPTEIAQPIANEQPPIQPTIAPIQPTIAPEAPQAVQASIIAPSLNRQETEPRAGESAVRVAIADVFPNPNQPRKQFNEEKMNELASSIRVHGVIQPIIVAPVENRYMIIAGERRYRAAIMVGAQDIPAIIRNYSPLQIKEISLIENLQREDLNPIETANYIKQLMTEYQFTQEVIADRIGKSRSAVANTLRLLTLPPAVLKLVEDERLSAGHARALVVVENKDHQYKLAMQAADNKMSVRDLEKAVKKHNKPAKVEEKPEQSIELKELILEMQRALATKVSVIGNDRRGRIYIDYYTTDDLDRINDIITLWQNHK